MVTASLHEEGLLAQIDMRDGSAPRIIQPLSTFQETDDSSLHVLYNELDMTPDLNHVMAEPRLWPGYGQEPMAPSGVGGTRSNGGSSTHNHQHGDSHTQPGSLGGPGSGRADKTVEFAADCDYEFYNKNGGSTSRTVQDVEDVINAVDSIYQRDVEICYDIGDVIVRTTSNDPYTSNNAGTLLDQFRAEWRANMGHIQRDVAELFTGRTISGSVIGVAWLGVICNSNYGYSMVQSRYTSNWSRRVSLSAHELGHNWNSDHCCGSCSGCNSCHIMCPCNGGCSGNVSKFGNSSISSILSHKNSRSCLDSGCGGGGGGGGNFTLSDPTPGYAGTFNTVTVSNGSPNGSAIVYFGGVSGLSSTACSGVYIGIKNVRTAGTIAMDSSGGGTLSKSVPGGAAGRTFFIQALDTTNCTLSNMVTTTF